MSTTFQSKVTRYVQSFRKSASVPKERPGRSFGTKCFFSKPQFSERAPWALFRKITVVFTGCQKTGRLEWQKAINRDQLPKTVFVCLLHFIDGRPTERNPTPQLQMGYENKVPLGRRKVVRRKILHEFCNKLKKRFLKSNFLCKCTLFCAHELRYGYFMTMFIITYFFKLFHFVCKTAEYASWSYLILVPMQI